MTPEHRDRLEVALKHEKQTKSVLVSFAISILAGMPAGIAEQWIEVAEQWNADGPIEGVPRCDQCRFWRQRPEARSDGLCERIGLDLGAPAFPTKARVAFSNVNNAGLLTDADFGCVQWERKA